MMKKVLNVLKVILIALLVAALAFGIYVITVFARYYRIEDHQALQAEGSATYESVSTDTSYTIFSQNVGFGAYTADFTFFMDGGKSSWAESEESVISCINQAADEAKSHEPDFILFQEIDIDSTRSYHVDESVLLTDALDGYAHTFAKNYHSAFLFYPLIQPHGASNSGILTYSKYDITGGERRSLPISDSFSKILDLDRCYSISRIPVDNGKELILINLHTSAYGGSDEIRRGQTQMLMEDALREYQAGNYVIMGGDFNQDFTGDSFAYFNPEANGDYGWAQPFLDELIPDGLSKALDYSNGEYISTTRNCDIPYDPDKSIQVIIDGFIVSDNVQIDYLENVQLDYRYSDHNPVVMQFTLLD